jgi:hypothetical protein
MIDGGWNMILDLTVKPDNPVYRNLEIEAVGGRFNLKNSMDASVLHAIGENVTSEYERRISRGKAAYAQLTGGAPIQVYLVAFHVLAHRCVEVAYRDGKGLECTVCRHG